MTIEDRARALADIAERRLSADRLAADRLVKLVANLDQIARGRTVESVSWDGRGWWDVALSGGVNLRLTLLPSEEDRE